MRKASLDDEITAFEVADTTHPLTKILDVHVWRGSRRQIANTHRLYGPLRPRRERPRGHSATANHCDELAPLHSITSSAVICMINGTVRPSALAVLRLITNSSLVGCSTGKSVGL